jgi:hypothetical protein
MENNQNKINQIDKDNNKDKNKDINNINISKENKIKINFESIEEFPPSYKLKENNFNEINKDNINNNNNNINNINPLYLQQEYNDDFDKFVKNFQLINTNTNSNKKEIEKEKEIITYKEINTQNIKTKIIKFNNKEFFISFMAYSNINFIMLSQEKKIGNLYEAEIEEPEFQIDQEEDEEELPPNYEIKCLLGNRFDNLNNYISNFIAGFLFNIFDKAEKKANEIKPKFFKETEESILNTKIRENLFKDLYFIDNELSFYNNYVKCFSNMLISLDLRIENILKKENLDLKLIEYDEFEISEKTSDFMDLLRKELIEILN